MSVRAVAVIRPVNNPRYSPVPYQPVSQGQLEASRASRRSAAVDSVTLRMFTGLTSRNCPIKSQIGVCPCAGMLSRMKESYRKAVANRPDLEFCDERREAF